MSLTFFCLTAGAQSSDLAPEVISYNSNQDFVIQDVSGSEQDCVLELVKKLIRKSGSPLSQIDVKSLTYVTPRFFPDYYTFEAVLPGSTNTFTGWIYAKMEKRYKEDSITGARTHYNKCLPGDRSEPFSILNSRGTEVLKMFNFSTTGRAKFS